MLSRGLIVILLISMIPTTFIEGVVHPRNSMEDSMTCEEFGRTARFNPYSVLDDIWFIFYSWGSPIARKYKFFYPTTKEKEYVRRKLHNITKMAPVNWTARMIFMKEIRTNFTSLLVEKGDRGEFWEYHIHAKLRKGETLAPLDIRLKQTCENRFIGYMNCKNSRVYAMSRLTQIPKRVYLNDAAAAIGYRGRGGTSYLYQGHHWMPIEEQDEEEYWLSPEVHKQRVEALDKYITDNPVKDKPDYSDKSSFFPKSIVLEKRPSK